MSLALNLSKTINSGPNIISNKPWKHNVNKNAKMIRHASVNNFTNQDQCLNFYEDAMSAGQEYINKIHK